MRAGSVPLAISSNTSCWFLRVRSTPACAAATPLPGTTIACTSIRPFAGKLANAACGTQVADAITTSRVF